MQWNRVGSVIEQMLADLDSLGKDQGKVDTAYTKLLELIDREAGLNDDTTSNKRRNTPYKPYWDKELSSLWKQVRDKVCELKSAKKRKVNRKTIEIIKKELNNSSKDFDKTVRGAKRKYQR